MLENLDEVIDAVDVLATMNDEEFEEIVEEFRNNELKLERVKDAEGVNISIVKM